MASSREVALVASMFPFPRHSPRKGGVTGGRGEGADEGEVGRKRIQKEESIFTSKSFSFL